MSQKVSLRCKARSLLFPRAHTDPALDVRFFGFFFCLIILSAWGQLKSSCLGMTGHLQP